MIKQLTSFLDYSLCAEIALIIFASVFIAVVIRTLRINKELTDLQAHIVLNESDEIKETR